MKIAILSASSSIHTIRWVNGLASRGLDVNLISCHKLKYQLNDGITYHQLPFNAPYGYILSFIALRKLLSRLKPDILNAHYASGYGLLARLCRYKPLLLSVWGSDVYTFPEHSVFCRKLIEKNLSSATAIASTSRCMALKASQIYSHQHVFITPFGIDENIFKPEFQSVNEASEVVIGTVKGLKRIYAIDNLIKAFHLVWLKIGKSYKLRLEISGSGPELENLKALVDDLGIGDLVVFHGAIAHEDVPVMLNRLTVFSALSREESFGVSILEAGSCGKPVVVSDADGFTEVVVPGQTGFIVPRDDIESTSNALIQVIVNHELQEKMSMAGRKHILDHYTWEKSIDTMIDAYCQTISLYSS